jgi:hypothetical protein
LQRENLSNELRRQDEELRLLNTRLEDNQVFFNGCWYNYKNALARFSQMGNCYEEEQLRGHAIAIECLRQAKAALNECGERIEETEREIWRIKDQLGQLDQPAQDVVFNAPPPQPDAPSETDNQMHKLRKDQSILNEMIIQQERQLESNKRREAELANLIEVKRLLFEQAKADVPQNLFDELDQLKSQGDKFQCMIDAKSNLQKVMAEREELNKTIARGQTDIAETRTKLAEIAQQMFTLEPPLQTRPRPVGVPRQPRQAHNPQVMTAARWLACQQPLGRATVQ